MADDDLNTPQDDSSHGRHDTAANADPSPKASATANADAASRAADDVGPAKGVDPSEREKTFETYQNALEHVDWSYKLKSGEERDIGHKSMVTAERAFIAASLHDPKAASKIYEQHAGKPPKEELLKRASAARTAGAGADSPGLKIDDLTAGIANVSARRDQQKLQGEQARLITTKDQIEAKMGTWRTNLSDNAEQRRGHAKRGNDELMKQEKPRPDGLHLLSALRSGMRAGGEYATVIEHRRRGRDIRRTVLAQRNEYKAVTDQIKKFETMPGIDMKATTGPNGQDVSRFTRATDVVKSALRGTKAPIVGAPVTARGPASPGTAISQAIASRGAGR